MRRFMTAAGVLVLAACDGGQHGGAAQTSSAKPAGSTLTAFPTRRPGLWEQTMARDGRPLKMRLCLDAATDARLDLIGRQATTVACRKPVLSRLPGGELRFVSSCSMGAAGTRHNDRHGERRHHQLCGSCSQTEVETGAPLAPMNGRHVIDVTARYSWPVPGRHDPRRHGRWRRMVKGNINRLGRGFQGPPSAPG